jgi:DNA-binding PadR family transcriptional regulator
VTIIGVRQSTGGYVSATAESFLPLKPAYFHILLSVATRATHGYGIRQQVEERTRGRIVLAAGTLYETLQRLTRDGLVQETEAPPEAEQRASSRWRFYLATPLARQVLALEVARLDSDIAAARAQLPSTG